MVPETTPRAPPPVFAIALSPFFFAVTAPTLFDSYSAGVLLLQLLVPELRPFQGLRAFKRELEVRMLCRVAPPRHGGRVPGAEGARVDLGREMPNFQAFSMCRKRSDPSALGRSATKLTRVKEVTMGEASEPSSETWAWLSRQASNWDLQTWRDSNYPIAKKADFTLVDMKGGAAWDLANKLVTLRLPVTNRCALWGEREDLVDSHGRWKRPCLQATPDATR